MSKTRSEATNTRIDKEFIKLGVKLRYLSASAVGSLLFITRTVGSLRKKVWKETEQLVRHYNLHSLRLAHEITIRDSRMRQIKLLCSTVMLTSS